MISVLYFMMGVALAMLFMWIVNLIMDELYGR